MFAVTIDPLNAIAFLAVRPQGEQWSVQDEVEIDLPSNYADWSPGAAAPGQILCVSTSDKKRFKVFKSPHDINRAEFRPTGRNFGGVFSRVSWERFVSELPELLLNEDVTTDEPPGATEEAVRVLKGGH